MCIFVKREKKKNTFSKKGRGKGGVRGSETRAKGRFEKDKGGVRAGVLGKKKKTSEGKGEQHRRGYG